MADDPPQQKLTALDLESWLTAPEALRRVMGSSITRATATKTIVERLIAARLRSGAADHTLDDSATRSGVIEIEPERWSWAARKDVSGYAVWLTGNLRLRLETRFDPTNQRPSRNLSYFGVKFETTGIDSILEAAGMAPTPAKGVDSTSAANPRGAGAPVKPWWEEFWIEMVCRQHAGDIQPDSTQAHVARVMMEWASKNDKDLGETVAKEKAKILLRALKKTEVGN